MLTVTMSKKASSADFKPSSNFNWILVILLVAGSSFLIGSSFRQKQSTQTTATVSASKANQPTNITDISNALATDTPAVFDPTAAVSPSTSSTSPKPAIGVVSINTGSESELESLPGIGPSIAKAIIDYRNANGPFVTTQDIEKVKGIGPKTYDSLKSKISI